MCSDSSRLLRRATPVAPHNTIERTRAMAVKNLTKRTVDSLRPAAARYDVYDADLKGFVVRVMTDGSKTFSVVYRAGSGRTAPKRRVTLGRYGTLTVEEARLAARKALAEVATGGDPANAIAAGKRAPSMAVFGADFLADVDARLKPGTAREYRRMWDRHVAPSWATKRVADVGVADVTRLHRALHATPYHANRVLALIGSFFSYAERQGVRDRYTNPARDVRPYKEESRERFLNQAEVARLGEALTRALKHGLPAAPNRRRKRTTGKTAKHRPKSADKPIPANPFAVAAIRFLVLTGWREREALTLKWSDVDLSRGVAILPNTKTGKSMRTIGAPARLLLIGLQRIDGSPFVFPGRSADRPLVEMNRLWYAVRAAAQLNDVRLHDLRHSFASVTVSNGASLPIIGKLLGHRETATTAKYAHLFDDPVRAAADATANQLAAWLDDGPQPPVSVQRVGDVADPSAPYLH